jgi:biotin carboxyl carrier protein
MSDDVRARDPGAVAPADPDPAARLAAHAQIARLADDILPALVARLGATGLGELEVREGSWRIRLRMPPGPRPGPAAGARRGGRAGTSLVGGAPKPGSGATSTVADAGVAIGPDPELATPGLSETAQPAGGSPPSDRAAPRVVARAPAVGFYQPRAGLAPGSRVRAGERLGIVDVLGVPQEILAPGDGLLGAALVEPGEPVEYGQEIVVVERLPANPAAPSPASQPAAAEVTP